MNDVPVTIERAFESHDAFVATDDGYDLETTVFETHISARDAEGERDGRVSITVLLPSLGAAVDGETVASVVEDDWFDTLERRLQPVFTVAHTSTHGEPILERDDETVRVLLEYVAWDAIEGAEDAKALVEFVEGTYVEGIIPGYEYRGEAAALLENAYQRGKNAENNDESGTY